MSSLGADRKPVDYGVQIRFIKDLEEPGGSPLRTKTSSPNSTYGVAVRVQGISGQPYVVLKEGEKDNSYGVQLKPTSQTIGSLPKGSAEEGPFNPYTEGNLSIGRARSQDSLLGSEAGEPFVLRQSRPPGDGRSNSCGSLSGDGEEDVKRKKTRGSALEWRNGGGGDELDLANDCFPAPPPPVCIPEDQTSAVDTNSLASINRLISKFDSSGRKNRTPSQRKLESRKAPSSPAPVTIDQPPSLVQCTPINPYSSPSSSSSSPYSSIIRNADSMAKEKISLSTAPSKSVSLTQSSPIEIQLKQDLLKDQGKHTDVTKGEETKEAIYNVLKEGTTESTSFLKRRVSLVLEKMQELQARQKGGADDLKAELEECLEENMNLQEQLDRKTDELHEAHAELAQLRMDRESAEAQARLLEDQRAELQEELRQLAEGNSAEKQASGLEESLRQRERELTALKGVLKDEVTTHDQEMEMLREQYSHDMEGLRASLLQLSQSQQDIEAERHKVNNTIASLQHQLDNCRKECDLCKAECDGAQDELHKTKQELLQARLEKDELRDLQERLTAMKKKLPEKDDTLALNKDLQDSRNDLKQAREELDKKSADMVYLKKVSQDVEAELKCEMDRLREQWQKEKKDLLKALERANQCAEPQGSSVEWLRDTERELNLQREQLSGANKEIQAHKEANETLEETNARLRERLGRLETQLQSSVFESSEAEQTLEEEKRSLRGQLEEARRSSIRTAQERDELARRLEEREREREALRRGKSDLEEQKRLLDRALDKLSKDMEQINQESRQSVVGLHGQLEELRERGRKEQLETQRLAKERLSELQKAQTLIRSLQEEVSRLKKELLECTESRDSALLDKQLLNNRLKHLEEEVDAEKALLANRSREIRLQEDKVKSLEMELDEEKTNVELLNERMSRNREQVDQLRSELMQQRSTNQDLELDKCLLERQLKELRNRVDDMKEQPRSANGISQLESRVQELEERLHSEEREKSSLQSVQRRLERKLKELNISVDEERHRFSEQKDQMALRMKAVKRQMDESESEVERLEGQRRKAVREMEEHLEQQEILHARIATLEAELRRRNQQSRRPTLDKSALSSEDEDGLFDMPLLPESLLQTSSS